MALIDNSLPQLRHAIETQAPIVCQENSRTWSTDNRFLALFKSFAIWKAPADVALVRTFAATLDRIERVPVAFEQGRVAAQQEVNFQEYLDTAKALEARVTLVSSSSKWRGLITIAKVITIAATVIVAFGASWPIGIAVTTSILFIARFNQHWRHVLGTEAAALSLRIIALQGRLHIKRQSTPQQADERSIALQEMVQKLKQQDPLVIKKGLDQQDLLKVRYISTAYPEFTDRLLRDSALQQEFHQRVMKTNLSIDVLVQFPAIQRQIARCNVDTRICRLVPDGLKVTLRTLSPEQSLRRHKIVTLRIEGHDENILDEQKVITFPNGNKRTIKQIFDVFADKEFRSGELECTSKGITNWMPTEQGVWSDALQKIERIDLNRADWWTQLPHIETITPQQVLERYGKALAPGQAGLCALGSRQKPTLDPLDGHGWLEVLIPASDGNYHVYPMGKYAATWPTNAAERIKMFAGSLPAKMEFPDENTFRSDRQRGQAFYALTADQFPKLMSILRDDLIKVREGNIVFQFLGDNCASWVQSVFDRLYGPEESPRLYDQQLWKFDLAHPALNGIFGGIRALVPTQSLKDKCLTTMLKLFGGNEGVTIMENGQPVKKTVLSSEQMLRQRQQNPAVLVQNYVAACRLQSAN